MVGMSGKCMIQILSVNEPSKTQLKGFWARLWSPLKVPCVEQMALHCSLTVSAVVSDTRKVLTFQWISAAHSEWQSTRSIVEGPCSNVIEKPDVVNGLAMRFFFRWTIRWVPKHENINHAWMATMRRNLRYAWMCSYTYNRSSTCFQCQWPRNKLLFVALWKEWVSWT